MRSHYLRSLAVGLGLGLLFSPPALQAAQARATAHYFATAQEAVDALVLASRAHQPGALRPLIGEEGERLFHSHDPSADQHGHSRFSTAYDEGHRLEFPSPDRAILVVGREDWPMPVPLVHSAEGWAFDAEQGAQEILNRRIGRNELDVIEVCRAFVLAQQEYANLRVDGGVPEFARHLKSHAHHHDGLYWPAATGEAASPLGPLVAAAAADEGGSKNASPPRPYRGYLFRILLKQGPHAPGGPRSYVVDGHMTGGFALLAYPARYAQTGVMSFIVNQNGIVREKNLGPQTEQLALAMDSYDPDASWIPTRPAAGATAP